MFVFNFYLKKISFLFFVLSFSSLFSGDLNKIRMINISKSMTSLFFLKPDELKKKIEIYQSNKLNNDDFWEKPEIISNQFFGVSEDFKIKQDKEGNVIIAWLAIDLEIENYVLCASVFLLKTNKWSDPFLISDRKENLTRNFSIMTSDKCFVVTWFVYDENFNTLIRSRQFTKEKDWENAAEVKISSKIIEGKEMVKENHSKN